MTFREYVILSNIVSTKNQKSLIDLDKVDLSEDKEAGELMSQYVEMLKEKMERRALAQDERTFNLTGIKEEDEYLYDSLAGTYVYENQFERKELQEKIAELTSLSLDQIKNIAKNSLSGHIVLEFTDEDREELVKHITQQDQEPEQDR